MPPEGGTAPQTVLQIVRPKLFAHQLMKLLYLFGLFGFAHEGYVGRVHDDHILAADGRDYVVFIAGSHQCAG